VPMDFIVTLVVVGGDLLFKEKMAPETDDVRDKKGAFIFVLEIFILSFILSLFHVEFFFIFSPVPLGGS
jgi:hypothetical protein